MQEFSTPMMKQYGLIKKRYPDCLLFFRLGDFYELFMDDAKIGSEVLGITLTARPRGVDGKIPMAGVPYHAVDSYLNKLVRAGYKVAICEQLSEPDKKGIVERDVIRVVTPGTILDERALEKKTHNYIVSLDMNTDSFALAVADFSTGQLQTEEYPLDHWKETLRDEITRIFPTECILPDSLYNDPEVLKILKTIPGITIFLYPQWEKSTRYAGEELKKHFQVKTLAAYHIDQKILSQQTCNALLSYLKETQKSSLPHINSIVLIPSREFVLLDRATIMNLELFSTIRERDARGSLIQAIDHTHTAMGGRLLKDWITHPLKTKKGIEQRLEATEELIGNNKTFKKIETLLSEITDIERTFSRVSVGIGNARDLVSIKVGLELMTSLKHSLVDLNSPLLQQCQKNISTRLRTIVSLIEENISDDPPIQLKEGGLIKDHVDKKLDELRDIVNGGKKWMAEMESTEREKTGIGSLKIRYNQVFGYYIEVSKSHIQAVPSHYYRKQTLVNGERYVTEQLKDKEEIILRAQETMETMEYEIYKTILKKVISFASEIQQAAHSIAIVDCIASFAWTAKKYSYQKPHIVYSHELDIVKGRHPVVEQMLSAQQFVPNNTKIGNPKQSLILLTGPNMAGKSVYLRQVALITLLAHIGSFIPVKKAYVPIVDSIFVRSGANDMISSGLSTFMVEMVETAFILNHATSNSLIIMDEIGRGTSTYDGVSIAWSVAEYLMKNFSPPPKTLFATHYHELIELAHQFPKKITNAHMDVDHTGDEPVFTHVLCDGPAYESYGVEVAKLAGVPTAVVTRANEMLMHFHGTQETKTIPSPSSKSLENELKAIKTDELTPLAALNILSELKKRAEL